MTAWALWRSGRMLALSKENGAEDMPKLVTFLLRHAMVGFVLAAAFVGLLLLGDVGGLASLAARDGAGVLAIGMLTFFVGLTFSSAQMGFAVMLARDSDDDEPRRGKRLPVFDYWFVEPARALIRVKP